MGFVPGARYRFGDSGFSLRLRYMFFGFNNIYDYNDNAGCVGKDKWTMDFGLRRLELGIAYQF